MTSGMHSCERRRAAPSPLSPLGPLIAELREARIRDERTRGRRTDMRSGASPVRAHEPDLRIETRVASDRLRHPAAKPWLLPASLAAHALLLGAAVVGPLLMSEAPPAPTNA